MHKWVLSCTKNTSIVLCPNLDSMLLSVLISKSNRGIPNSQRCMDEHWHVVQLFEGFICFKHYKFRCPRDARLRSNVLAAFLAPQCAALRCPWMGALLVPVVRVPSCARGLPCVFVYCTCTKICTTVKTICFLQSQLGLSTRTGTYSTFEIP